MRKRNNPFIKLLKILQMGCRLRLFKKISGVQCDNISGKLGWAPPSNFKFCALCELYVISGNSAHHVNTTIFYYRAKVHFNGLFYFFDLGTHISFKTSVPPPKLHPFYKENPSHTAFPLKMNVDFFTQTLILEPHRH